MPFHLVGIDEAGYGPQLGPLVVSAVVLELPYSMLAHQLPLPKIACLWKKLSRVIAPGKSRDKIAVCDSKALYQPARGITELEKTALVFKRLIEPDYHSHNGLTLPVSVDDNEINKFTKILRTELTDNSIKFCEVKASIVEPADFNSGIRRLQNKADFLWEVSGELIKHCVDKYSNKNMVVVRAGKQGGRNYYLSCLQRLFAPLEAGRPSGTTVSSRSNNVAVTKNSKISSLIQGKQAPLTGFADKIVRPVGQGFDNSSYIVKTKPSSNASVSFIRDGDSSEFAIALASIFSKYYRELAMLKLNRFFQSHIPSLKPTSGYYTDSQRFIRAVNPLFSKLGLDRNDFIRIR